MSSGHVRTIGVKRPGFGTGGKAIQVTVNAFAANVTNGVIYHYDGQSIFIIRVALTIEHISPLLISW